MPASRPRSRSGMVWFQMVERPSPLSMSPAPARPRHTSTSQTLAVQPAAAMARPQPAAPNTTSRPCRRVRETQPLVRLTSREPTEPAAYIRPSDQSASSSSARNGKMVLGKAKNIAARSMAYVPSSTGLDQAYRAPSTMPRREGRAAFSWGGTGVRRRHIRTETAKQTTVVAYAGPLPAYATTSPASAGPAMAPACQRRAFSAAAAASWSCGTIRASSESMAGRWSPARAATPAATTYSGQSMGFGSRVFSSRIRASRPRPASVRTMTLRRSTASASAPPYRPKTTSGTSSTAPMAPTASGEPVRSLIWSGSAISAITLPR